MIAFIAHTIIISFSLRIYRQEACFKTHAGTFLKSRNKQTRSNGENEAETVVGLLSYDGIEYDVLTPRYASKQAPRVLVCSVSPILFFV